MSSTRPRAACPVCRLKRVVTAAGRIDLHLAGSGPAACAGSGQRPVGSERRSTCEVCGAKIAQPARAGRPRTTCSDACRMWKHRGRDRLL